MNNKIDTVYNCLKKIVVNSPFDDPKSDNICQTGLEINESYSSLNIDEKNNIKALFTDFELRSLQARVGELCECAINSSKTGFLFSALVLFDIGCKDINIEREEFSILAKINHTINISFSNKITHDEIRSLVPYFYKKFKVFLERDDELNSLEVFNLKLSKDKSGKFIFKLKSK